MRETVLKSSGFRRLKRKLEKKPFPASLKKFGEYLFDECRNLKKISFQKGSRMKKLPDYCFSSYSGLDEVDIPENVTYVGRELFRKRYFSSYCQVKKINIKGDKMLLSSSNVFNLNSHSVFLATGLCLNIWFIKYVLWQQFLQLMTLVQQKDSEIKKMFDI